MSGGSRHRAKKHKKRARKKSPPCLASYSLRTGFFVGERIISSLQGNIFLLQRKSVSNCQKLNFWEEYAYKYFKELFELLF